MACQQLFQWVCEKVPDEKGTRHPHHLHSLLKDWQRHVYKCLGLRKLDL